MDGECAGNPFKGGTAEVIRRWIENIKARGGELLTNTRVTKLIMTDGRVTGVEATTKSGDKLIIHAKKVIIATGGFAANKEMLAQYVFDSSALGMVELIWLRSPVVDGRTGDGINMARLVGAGVAGMHAVAGITEAQLPAALLWDIPVSDIASLVHAERAMTSRAVGRMVSSGLLERSGRTFVLKAVPPAARLWWDA